VHFHSIAGFGVRRMPPAYKRYHELPDVPSDIVTVL